MDLYQIYYCIPFLVALLAQFIKIIIDSFSGKHITFRSMLVSGGMPSAHSTLTSSVLMMVILIEWLFSVTTMIVTVFALLVRYDAANVRYESGKHAQYINSLRIEMHKVMTQEHMYSHAWWLDRLKERLGHTPVEIIVGILFWAAATLALVSLFDTYLISFSIILW